jgi:CBS domain-containing protein
MSKKVGEVMTRDPILVQPQTSLEEAIKILAEKRIGGLPVVDDSGKLLGVISEGDLMWQEAELKPPAYIMLLDSVIYLENPGRYQRELHKALGQTVGEVMSDHVWTIKPEKSVKDAARLLNEKRIDRLPVIDDNGHVVGIITRGDIVRFMASGED